MRANLRDIAEAADPYKALMDRAGDLSDYEVFHNLVLVATFIGPSKSAGGIHFVDKKIDEDRWQGKVGLVLKVGPRAFVDEPPAVLFGGVLVKPGDWVAYRPSDGIELFIRDRRKANEGLPCRLIEDSMIKGRVSDPGLIY